VTSTFRGMLEALEASLVPRIRAFSESPEMLAIRWGLPWSFVGLGIGLPIFMLLRPSGSLLDRFSHSFAAAFGVMSALLVLLLTIDLARRRAVPVWLALGTAAVAFGLSLPYAGATSFVGLATALGSSGLFLAIGIALVDVNILRLARARLGNTAGSLAGGIAIVGIAVFLLWRGISLTLELDRLIEPIGTLGDTLTALLVLTFVETLLWTVGIHGPALLAAVVLPVYIKLQLENTDALAHGQPLPHIVTVSIFLFVFPGGAGATLPAVLLLLRSKVKRIRTVAFATLVPSIFNANEPLMFGLPVVLNPTLGVPFVVAPLVLALITYYATALGWVARTAYYIPSTIPIPFNVFIATRDWRSIVLIAVDFFVAMVIYAPFVAIYERQELKRESESEPAA
jgi:PTS system cellobiose-specific IIC component